MLSGNCSPCSTLRLWGLFPVQGIVRSCVAQKLNFELIALLRNEQETPEAIKIRVEISYRVQCFRHHKYISILVDLQERRITSVQQESILARDTTYDTCFVENIVWIFVLRKFCFQVASQFIPLETVARDCLLSESAWLRCGGRGSL